MGFGLIVALVALCSSKPYSDLVVTLIATLTGTLVVNPIIGGCSGVRLGQGHNKVTASVQDLGFRVCVYI